VFSASKQSKVCIGRRDDLVYTIGVPNQSLTTWIFAGLGQDDRK